MDPKIEEIDDAAIETLQGSEQIKVTSSVENFDDVEDETLSERLWGLTEMFPEPLRNGTLQAANLSVTGVKKAYRFTRSSLWILGTSFVILGLPVIFEVERVQTEEAALMQQRQILLGPGGGGQQPPLNLQPQMR
ncbi:mitochondrial import receptor subunit TOM22 homolog [Clytia hemisphaerica]|eukprot:TCONS_00024732-protein